MWVVIKTENNCGGIIKNSMEANLGEKITFYTPKIKIQKFKKNKIILKKINLLGNYMFCYNEKFADTKILDHLKFTRGLKYFLNGFQNTQDDIENFITKCRKLENSSGAINQNFFDLEINKLYKFCDGPFCQKIFKLISQEKNNIKILIGSITTTIKTKKYLAVPA